MLEYAQINTRQKLGQRYVEASVALRFTMSETIISLHHFSFKLFKFSIHFDCKLPNVPYNYPSF